MKALLEFNLPEDQVEFDQCINGGKAHSVIWDMHQLFRTKTKHNPDQHDDATLEVIEALHEELWEFINHYGLSLE